MKPSLPESLERFAGLLHAAGLAIERGNVPSGQPAMVHITRAMDHLRRWAADADHATLAEQPDHLALAVARILMAAEAEGRR